MGGIGDMEEPTAGRPDLGPSRQTRRKRVAVSALGLLAAVTLLVGAALFGGGITGTRSGSGGRSVASSAPGNDLAVSPSVSAVASVPPRSAASVSASDSGRRTSCGGVGLAKIWASWPMPNSKSSGLPNPASYTNLGDGTVRDNVTCLVWQRGPAPSTYTFSQANAYCGNLSLAGGGWHLPSRIELTSIIDPTRDGPAIDTSAFPSTPSRFFWTSSPWAVNKSPARAWIINFYESLASNAADQTGAYNVRCVRSTGAGSARPAYQVSGGQVTDPNTGLIWQQGISPAMAADAAPGYCAGLVLGGLKWRLPSVQELATTVDESRVAPAVDMTVFPGTAKAAPYWTATRPAPDPSLRWVVNFEDGYTNYRAAATGYARCVR